MFQVSINLTPLDQEQLHVVDEAIKREFAAIQ